MSDAIKFAVSEEPVTPVPLSSSGKVPAVTNGKGGAIVSVNLAAALAKIGHKVLVVDAGLGLANLDVMLTCTPKLPCTMY